MAPLMDSNDIYDQVGKHYGAAARNTRDDANYAQRVANAFGYSEADLKGMPQDANLGLSCGNPIALANLQEGETVCDLGSGAGFDVFQAAKKVGTTGRAIGVDFNKDMLHRASTIQTQTHALNTTFVESPITRIPLPDASVDCIISNCVVNLVPEPDKPLVFAETFRLLRPGGRLAISDILARRDLPARIRDDMALYVGCIAGASPVAAYEEYLRKAGFNDVLIVDAQSDLNVYWKAEGGGGACCGPAETVAEPAPASESAACCAPPAAASEGAKSSPQGIDFNEFAGSFKIFAIKP